MVAFADLWSETVSDPNLRDWGLDYARRQHPRISRDVALVRSMNPKTVLNVGGAPFLFEHMLSEADPHLQVVSIDLAPERFGSFAKSVPFKIIAGNIETGEGLEELADVFDVVAFNLVFEHCRIDLIAMMDRLAGLIAPGGKLILSTPNGLSSGALRRLLRGRTGPDLYKEWSKLHRLGHVGHVREYSRRELESFFRQCNFRLESVGYQSRRIDWRKRNILWNAYVLAKRAVPMLSPTLLFVLSPNHAGSAERAAG